MARLQSLLTVRLINQAIQFSPNPLTLYKRIWDHLISASQIFSAGLPSSDLGAHALFSYYQAWRARSSARSQMIHDRKYIM
jgi:hypothetical protein